MHPKISSTAIIRYLIGPSTDNMIELTSADRRGVYNLKFYLKVGWQ